MYSIQCINLWPSNDREHLEKMMESDDEVYELDLWDALNTVQCMDMASPFVTGPGQSFPHVNWSMAVSPFQVPPKPHDWWGQLNHLWIPLIPHPLSLRAIKAVCRTWFRWKTRRNSMAKQSSICKDWVRLANESWNNMTNFPTPLLSIGFSKYQIVGLAPF